MEHHTNGICKFNTITSSQVYFAQMANAAVSDTNAQYVVVSHDNIVKYRYTKLLT